LEPGLGTRFRLQITNKRVFNGTYDGLKRATRLQRQQQSTPGRRVIVFKQKRRVPQTPTQLVPTHSDSVGYLKIYNIYNYKSLTL